MDSLAQPVEVRVFSSDDEMNVAMQKKLDAIYAEIDASAPVAEACAVHEGATQNVAKLKAAQQNLTLRSREIFDELKEVSSSLDATLIESDRADLSKKLRTLTALEAEHKAVLRANSRVLEHLLPQAEISELRLTSEHLSIKARAVREAASQRIQKTAQMLAEAAEYEGGIVFDSVNTLSGELQRQASELERQAANYAMWAREREENYLRMAKELDNLWTRN